MQSGTALGAFDLFRHAKRAARCCAVPQGAELPPMIEADPSSWPHAGRLDLCKERPPGFNEDVAIFSCSVQGFYLFDWHVDQSAGSPYRRRLLVA